MTKKLNSGVLYGFISAFGFSAYVVLNRWIYTKYHVQSLNLTVTFLASAGIFGAVSLLFNKQVRTEPLFSKKALPLVVNGLIAGLAIGLIVFGQNFTTAINASFLATATVITTAFFSKWLLQKYYSRNQWLWLIVLFTGIYISVVGLHRIHINKGDLFVILAIGFLGFTNVFSRVVMKNFSSRTVADIRMATGGLAFLLVGLLVGGYSIIVTSAGLWPFVSGFFYWLGIAAFVKSIKEIGPNIAILITTTHPVWTSLAAVFILSEPFGVGELIGGTLILLSVYQINNIKSNTA